MLQNILQIVLYLNFYIRTLQKENYYSLTIGLENHKLLLSTFIFNLIYFKIFNPNFSLFLKLHKILNFFSFAIEVSIHYSEVAK
jgi:hypothetical protein